MSARETLNRWVEAMQILCGHDDNPGQEGRADYAEYRQRMLDGAYAEVAAERDAETVAWLVKKSREFRAEGQTVQADTASILASKVERGAVRPDNLRMLPADFFEPGLTYTEDAPFRAPEDRSNFQCVAVAIHPTTGNRRALGFEQPGAGHPWRSSSLRDEEWADGWVEVTKGGAANA